MKHPNLEEKASRIKMIILDVDGVMTNGQVLLMPDGQELKTFSIHDGFGILCAMRSGIRIGIISGRASESLRLRCEELQIHDLYVNAMDKLPILKEIMNRHGFREDEIAYVGDDLPDLPVLESVGFSVAPKNAHPEVKKRVDLVLTRNGGEGAVRELIDFILLSQKKDQAILRQFTSS